MNFLKSFYKTYLEVYLFKIFTLLLILTNNNQLAQVQNNEWLSAPIAKVEEVCWSPSGQNIASVGWNESVSIWNSFTGEQTANLLGHSFSSFLPIITSVSWSHNGDKIASGNLTELILWDTKTDTLINKITAGTSWVYSIKWSPNDSLLAYESRGYIHIINSQNGNQVSSFYLHNPNFGGIKTGVCWLNNQTVMAGSVDGEFIVYDVKSESVTHNVKFSSSQYGIYDIAISPDGKLLSIVSYQKVYLVNAETFELQDSIKASQDYLWSSTWSPDGKFLATSGNWSQIRIYNSISKQIEGIIPFPSDTVQTANRSLAWSPDGSKVLVGSQLKDQSGRVSVWDIKMNLTNISGSDLQSKPASFLLYQNYPNPFNPVTIINFSIPKSSNVMIKVYDDIGREITTLVNEDKLPGEYQVIFNAKGLTSGIYFYKLFVDDYTETKKLVLLK